MFSFFSAYCGQDTGLAAMRKKFFKSTSCLRDLKIKKIMIDFVL